MSKPIDLYYWPTPNGWKASIMLEECGLDYTMIPVDIGKGAQFTPEFLAISPNNRMPAIVDHVGPGEPVPVFESGAILIYLAEKTGRFMAREPGARKETLEWLFWQVGNLGPMAGQYSHFRNYAPESEQHGYARDRYRHGYEHCLGVLDRRLEDREFIVADYSIADMISFPWVLIAKAVDIPLDPYPNVTRWRQTIKERPAVRRGVDLGKEEKRTRPYNEDERKNLFHR